MLRKESVLGGGAGITGVYGTLTQGCYRHIFYVWHKHAGLGRDSLLLDVGAGLGLPLWLAAVLGVRRTVGVENDPVKCHKATAVSAAVIGHLKAEHRGLEVASPRIVCCEAHEVSTLEPATHVLFVWQGWDIFDKRHYGRLVAAARSVQGIAIVQYEIKDVQGTVSTTYCFGDGWELVEQSTVQLAGGGKMQCYVFKRDCAHSSGNNVTPLQNLLTLKQFQQQQGRYLRSSSKHDATLPSNSLGRRARRSPRVSVWQCLRTRGGKRRTGIVRAGM